VAARGGEGSAVEQLQARAASQQARIQALMESLDREIPRQMNDSAEIQALKIANARLRLDNAKLEALLNA
jgi:hypothetical protein